MTPLQQAIKERIDMFVIKDESDRQYNKGYGTGFEAGAAWQKEQDALIIDALKEVEQYFRQRAKKGKWAKRLCEKLNALLNGLMS